MSNNIEHAARLNAVATAVAAELGPDWSVTQPAGTDTMDHLARLGNGTQSITFILRFYGDGKVEVSGGYADRNKPVYLPHRDGAEWQRPRINVSPTRPAKTIANDIRRRFLPAYEEVRAYVAERVEQANTAQAEQAVSIKSMADALGVEAPQRREFDTEPPSSVRFMADVWGDFRANHDGSSYTIDLHSVPAELAEQIARLISSAK